MSDAHEKARDLGRARVELAESLASPEDWKARWTPPAAPFPFRLRGWKHCICYTVDDFEAEAGFLIDVLGCEAPMFGPGNALLVGPDRDFCFQIAGAEEGEDPTPPETIGLMFSVENLREACAELAARGVAFTRPPGPHGGPESTFWTAEFATPHGVPVNVWGTVETPPA